MKTSRFSSLIALAVCAASMASAAVLGGCSALTAAPSDAQVTAVKSACVVDALARPTFDTLLVLATPAENQAVQLARKVIDPVCANPAAPLAADAQVTFSESTAQIANILAQLQARKKAIPAAAAASGAVAASSAG